MGLIRGLGSGPAQARLLELRPGLPPAPPLRTGGQCGPVGTNTALGADWSCLCPRCGSSVKLLASLDPRFFIHKVALITSSSHVTARWQGTSLPSQGYPGAAPAGGHVRDWPQAGLTAEKRQTPHWDHTVP